MIVHILLVHFSITGTNENQHQIKVGANYTGFNKNTAVSYLFFRYLLLSTVIV